MSTDRELLELAAKAAGVTPQWQDKTLSLYSPLSADPIGWNPLISDGDALRLAVKLGFINPGCFPYASHSLDEENPDWYAATRRSIVRAAAEIGRGMP